MGLIVVDTSILVDNLRNDPGAVLALDRAQEDGAQLYSSVISRAELLAGMRTHDRRVTRALIDSLDWVAVSEDIAELGGNLAREYRASYPGLGLPDILIGATAQHVGGELWTRNPRHFPMFPGLRPPY
jgi:predicted nucleic acid-binding protein